MRKLTIEEKAKLYDKAIKVASDIKAGTATYITDGTPVIDAIFPELKESEDEKIRKFLLDYLRTLPNHFSHNGSLVTDWIAWLEKQGNLMKALQISNARIGELIEENYHLREQLEKQGENTYNKVLSELLHKVICTFINDPDIPYFDREKVSMEVLPYVERLEKQGEQKPAIIIPKFRVGDEIKTTNEAPLTITKITDSGYWSEDLFICSFENSAKWELVGKLIDKIEPKFKVKKGKWYVCIKDLLDNYANKAFRKGDIYLSTQDGSLIPSNSNVPYKVVCPDTYFRDWDIQDAKDGDVLASNRSIFIFSQEYMAGKPKAHCGIMNGLFLAKPEGCWTNEKCYPATREQRNILMKAMANAGYTFDFEKKELKEIEQKSVIEMKTPEESLGIDSDTYNKIVDECIYGEQKPAWSEEDEAMWAEISDLLWEGYKQSGSKFSWDNIRNWVIPKLKSLKERYTWNPSKEQIMALRWVLNNIPYNKHKEEINGLLEQLIKLYNYAENR